MKAGADTPRRSRNDFMAIAGGDGAVVAIVIVSVPWVGSVFKGGADGLGRVAVGLLIGESASGAGVSRTGAAGTRGAGGRRSGSELTRLRGRQARALTTTGERLRCPNNRTTRKPPRRESSASALYAGNVFLCPRHRMHQRVGLAAWEGDQAGKKDRARRTSLTPPR